MYIITFVISVLKRIVNGQVFTRYFLVSIKNAYQLMIGFFSNSGQSYQ
jgi:hypothetical protein